MTLGDTPNSECTVCNISAHYSMSHNCLTYYVFFRMKYVTCSTSSKVLDVLRAKGLDTGQTRAAFEHSQPFLRSKLTSKLR